MEKITIDLKEIEFQAFQFNGIDILIKPYLGMLDKIGIAMEYLSLLFEEDSEVTTKYYISEYALILQIVDIVTNIDVTDIQTDLLIYSGLWDEIKKKIVNYESFRYDLNRLILFYQNEKNAEISIGAVVERLGNKFAESMKDISQADIKELKETSETFVDALNKLNDTAPGIVKDRVVKRSKAKKPE